MKISDLKTDCKYFKGDVPCNPHKKYGVHCIDEKGNACEHYFQVKEKVLIIKLGAIGDVIRTTPLLEPIRKKFPNAKIFWLTLTPSVVPNSVDMVLPFNLASVLYLQKIKFDLVINLDKDKEACALMDSISATEKKGYTLFNGTVIPVDKEAEHKYLTGIFDDLSKKNIKNYLEEIFEICGFNYAGEKYILHNFSEYTNEWEINRSKKIVGLNTGCGGRWTSRLWADENWINLAKQLLAKGYEVVFLGGEQEDLKNKYYSETTGGKYFGHFKLEKFINLVDQCDLVVTAVTMAMHITLGLQKKIVLFNNIFNKHEFELFGLGEIIEPEKECKCFYKPSCNNAEYKCMNFIKVDTVVKSIEKLLGK